MNSSAGSAVGPMQQRIHDKLTTEFTPTYLGISNDSWKHRHHHAMKEHVDQSIVQAGETHFTVEIVSDKFDKLRTLQRHRLVNAALANEFDKGLHALAIKAMSPAEAATKAQ
ncbi:BolA domain UV induced protein Uvi31 [Microbotryomycetes sp. JL201]|nr:BolA domain UV induced protein Uvi31 [Microbotryomycetes sp. JL201]